MSAGYREQLKYHDARISRLGTILRERQEVREVEVRHQPDKANKEVLSIRLDTGEVVTRRAMTTEELQGKLFVDREPELEEEEEALSEPALSAKRKRSTKRARAVAE